MAPSSEPDIIACNDDTVNSHADAKEITLMPTKSKFKDVALGSLGFQGGHDISKDPERGFDPDVSGPEKSVEGDSLFSAICNLTNGCIGAGILSVPYAFSLMGWLLAGLCLLIFVFVTMFGMHLLAKCAHHMHSKQTSFGQLCTQVCPPLALVSDLAVFVFCFGCMISYLIVVGGLMPEALNQIFTLPANSPVLDRRVWSSISFVFFAVPLTCMKNIEKLAYTSAASIIFLTYFLALAFAFIFNPIPALDTCAAYAGNMAACHVKGDIMMVSHDWLPILQALPICVFAFAGHTNIFIIYNERKIPSVRSMNWIICPAMAAVFFIVTLFGIFGYLAYGSNTNSDILLNYPATIPVTVGRIGVSFSVSVTYPLLGHACRSAAIHFIERTQTYIENRRRLRTSQLNRAKESIPVNLTDLQEAEKKKAIILYWTTTVFVLVGSYVVSLFVTDLGIVFSVIGATAASLMVFIIPGVCYYIMFSPRYQDTLTGLPIPINDDWKEKGRRYGGVAMAIFGIIFSPVTLAVIFIK